MHNSSAITAITQKNKKQSQFAVVLRRLSKNPSAIIGLIVVCLLVIMAIFAPLIAPYPYDKQNLLNTRKPPSAEHIMGTDELGRDIFSRIVYGSRYSLSIGFLAVLFSNIIGMTLGALAGYFGGLVDDRPTLWQIWDGGCRDWWLSRPKGCTSRVKSQLRKQL